MKNNSKATDLSRERYCKCGHKVFNPDVYDTHQCTDCSCQLVEEVTNIVDSQSGSANIEPLRELAKDAPISTDKDLRGKIDIIWLWVTHGSNVDQNSVQRSIDETVDLINSKIKEAVEKREAYLLGNKITISELTHENEEMKEAIRKLLDFGGAELRRGE